jgi:aminoglycoside phosphotransferase
VKVASVDRRVDLDGSVVEVHGSGHDIVVTRIDIDGTVSSFRPVDDPALPGLRALVDPATRHATLAVALGDVTDRLDVSIVRYRAGRRATVRVELGGGSGDARTVYAKVFHDRIKAAAAATSLVHVVSQLDEWIPLRLPDLAGHHEGLGIVVLNAIDGEPLELPPPLGSAEHPHAQAAEVFGRLGEALAALHALDVGPLPLRSSTSDLAKARTRAERVSDGRVAAMLRSLLADLADRGVTDPLRLVPVHGDCKPSQVLLGPVITLLDPDHLGAGDAAGDVAQMHVSLLQEAIRREGAEPGPAAAFADVLIDAFDDGYRRRNRRADDTLAQRVRWFEQLLLVRKALRADARAPGSPLAGALAARASLSR